MKLNNKLIKYFLIPILIFFGFLFFYLNQYKKTPIRYWDEHDWIGKSYYFDLLVKRDFNNNLWLNVESYDHPKLAEYIYGAVIYPTYLNYKKNLRKKEYTYIHFLIDHDFYKFSSDQYQQYKNKTTFIDWGKKPWEVMGVSPDYLIRKFGHGIEKTINLIFIARKINVFILSLNVLVVYFFIFYFK